ncbi:cobalamin biosynthesis protein [Neorhizobium sp. CSC1952]|uniref:cobalamin biosynthesis protein n=1 Tax=Neorhizobium sp. CSC1952 TaxID=2978974 RepID=UPI0025A61800|nr:cobalamin biosynthesis protein [Rhizobium sp. CSC1952]WJR69002.1 cobalamin biosynthesis protein [Rhizobium sp. CSC1952]
MIVAGLGCRKGTSAESILSALDAACAAAGIPRESVTALATGEIKRHEAGIVELAGKLGLSLHVLDDAMLKQAEGRTKTVSQHSLAQTATPSLSEAAALALAGEEAELIAPRLIADGATCALARSKELFMKDGA